MGISTFDTFNLNKIMETKINLKAPNTANYSKLDLERTVFLAGSITGARDWQKEATDLLLPYFESGPDERYLIDPALKILKTGDLNPHFFWYGSFPIYWTALLNGKTLNGEKL